MSNRGPTDRRLIGLLTLAAVIGAHADEFAGVAYDPRTDELVVTMTYQGTNPDHRFTLQWGDCLPADDEHRLQQVTVVVADDQWNDAARSPFQKPIRFSLADVTCRPAQVTLRTAPRFYVSITIPAAPDGSSH